MQNHPSLLRIHLRLRQTLTPRPRTLPTIRTHRPRLARTSPTGVTSSSLPATWHVAAATGTTPPPLRASILACAIPALAGRRLRQLQTKCEFIVRDIIAAGAGGAIIVRVPESGIRGRGAGGMACCAGAGACACRERRLGRLLWGRG